MRLFRTPIWLHRWFDQYTWKINTNQKVIYLSFDDGPDPEVTPFVLETLAQYDAKAVFFCVGENLRRFPQIKEQVIQSGNMIANHTQHHLKGWSTSLPLYALNIEECEKYIGQEHSQKLFRPPYGRILSDQGEWLAQQGFKCIMWDILTYDYDASLNIQNALKNISRKSRNGSIVVFHDSKKSYPQLKHLLPAYLENMTSKGYTFELLTHKSLHP
jgi:peptidoglycan-N-acetylglucosamine deacetylase